MRLFLISDWSFLFQIESNTRMTHEKDLPNDNSKNRPNRWVCLIVTNDVWEPEKGRVCTRWLSESPSDRLHNLPANKGDSPARLYSSWRNSSVNVHNRGRVWYPVIPLFIRIKWAGYTIFQRKNANSLAKKHRLTSVENEASCLSHR